MSAPKHPVPFDHKLLDRLMDEAGIDILLVTSKHNVQYLLGGYRFFFFDYMDAIGVSRYLPVLVYGKGQPGHAAYIGNRLETFEKELDRFWPGSVDTTVWTSADALRLAAEHVRKIGGGGKTIGVEPSFLPMDAHAALKQALPHADIADCHNVLERLRARKTPEELSIMRDASERVIASMLAVFARAEPGMTKRDLFEEMRLEEVSRGLSFEYCLVTAGTSLNRSPSDQKIEAGNILSLDSGGNFKGYIGDLCRMGILGEPDAELEDLLGVIHEIQDAARGQVRPGATGQEIFAAAQAIIARSPHRDYLDFLAHGMGLVSHEAPQLTGTGPVPYQGHYENIGIEEAMVISVETGMLHPRRGFIKLEDTVAVTANGNQGYGDDGRGWTRAGDQAR